MKKLIETNILRLINSLTKSEKRSCGKWINQKYQGLRKDIPRLFHLLSAENKIKKSGKDSIFREVYGQREVDDASLRKAISILKKEIEAFLVYESLKRDQVQYQMMLSEIYRKRGLGKFFHQNIVRLEKEITQSPASTSFKYFQKYQLATEQYEFDSQMKRQQFDYLQEMTDDFSDFYVLEILKRACHLRSHQSFTSTQYEIKHLDIALEYARKIPLDQEPAFQIYYLIFSAGEEGSDGGSFDLLREALEVHWEAFPKQEIRDIYLLSINHCIRKLNQGSKPFLKEAFRLYKSAITKNVLYENGKLTPFTYKNIISIALALGEKDWAYRFLHDQKEFLHLAHRENTFAANLATYYYKIGQFEQAMELLQKVQFRDPYDNLQYRTLLMRIYYQLGEENALEHHLESFASYLYRHKNLGYHKGLYQNLIKVMRKILRSNLRDRSVRDRLIREIETNERLAEKSWLMNQLVVPQSISS